MNSCCKQDVHWPYIVWNEQFESHPQKPLFYSLKECNHDFEEDHWNYLWQLSSFFLFHWLIIDKDMLQTEFHLRSIHYDTELWDSHLHDIEMESRSKKETNTYNKSNNTQLIIVVDSQLDWRDMSYCTHTHQYHRESSTSHDVDWCRNTCLSEHADYYVGCDHEFL